MQRAVPSIDISDWIKTIEHSVIDQYPTDIEPIEHAGDITLNHPYANFMMLLYVLVKWGIISITRENYEKLAEAYQFIDRLLMEFPEVPVRELTKGLHEVEQIIDQIQRNPNGAKIVLRLLDGELSRESQTDYFTLHFFRRLTKLGLPLEILFSNGSARFLHIQNNSNPSSYYSAQHSSIAFTQRKVKKLVKSDYQPRLKLLSYSITANGIIIYTHTPMRFTRLQQLAAYCRVGYDDSTLFALCRTIDRINGVFTQNVRGFVKDVTNGSSASTQLMTDFDEKGVSDFQMPQQPHTDFTRQEHRPDPQLNYEVRFVNRLLGTDSLSSQQEAPLLTTESTSVDLIVFYSKHLSNPLDNTFQHQGNLDSVSSKLLRWIQQDMEHMRKSCLKKYPFSIEDTGYQRESFFIRYHLLQTIWHSLEDVDVIKRHSDNRYTQFIQTAEKAITQVVDVLLKKEITMAESRKICNHILDLLRNPKNLEKVKACQQLTKAASSTPTQSRSNHSPLFKFNDGKPLPSELNHSMLAFIGCSLSFFADSCQGLDDQSSSPRIEAPDTRRFLFSGI